MSTKGCRRRREDAAAGEEERRRKRRRRSKQTDKIREPLIEVGKQKSRVSSTSVKMLIFICSRAPTTITIMTIIRTIVITTAVSSRELGRGYSATTTNRLRP